MTTAHLKVLYFSKCVSKKKQHFCYVRFLHTAKVESSELEKHFQQKLLKVALLGRTNVGKSTLINQILQLNVCDVSKKIHTTLFPVKAAFTSNNTQIIFVDTPGVISQKEASRLPVKTNVVKWKNVLEKVDVIAVMEEANFLKLHMTFYRPIVNYLQSLKERKTLILIINKVDLLKTKTFLLELTDWLMDLEKNENWKIKFDKVFFVSALQNDGVSDITSYLLEKAKEGEWILSEDFVCDVPLDKLIINLIRAEFLNLNLLPYEMPYKVKYKINILEENDLGELFCEALVIVPKKKFLQMILSKKHNLKNLSQKIEYNLYSIFKKPLKLKVIVNIENNQAK